MLTHNQSRKESLHKHTQKLTIRRYFTTSVQFPLLLLVETLVVSSKLLQILFLFGYSRTSLGHFWSQRLKLVFYLPFVVNGDDFSKFSDFQNQKSQISAQKTLANLKNSPIWKLSSRSSFSKAKNRLTLPKGQNVWRKRNFNPWRKSIASWKFAELSRTVY